jgi:hypothetical protein
MTEPTTDPHVVIIGPDGAPVAPVLPARLAASPDAGPGPADEEAIEGEESVVQMVAQPAKVMRIGSMIKQLLDEVRAAPLDEAGRQRLRQIHERSIKELEAGLAPELVDELERITLPFSDEGVPSEAELRIAQAQLVGWLEGLFHGIQTALFAQQMQAQAQFEEIRRRALPPGASAQQDGRGPGRPDEQQGRGGGLYL